VMGLGVITGPLRSSSLWVVDYIAGSLSVYDMRGECCFPYCMKRKTVSAQVQSNLGIMQAPRLAIREKITVDFTLIRARVTVIPPDMEVGDNWVIVVQVHEPQQLLQFADGHSEAVSIKDVDAPAIDIYFDKNQQRIRFIQGGVSKTAYSIGMNGTAALSMKQGKKTWENLDIKLCFLR